MLLGKSVISNLEWVWDEAALDVSTGCTWSAFAQVFAVPADCAPFILILFAVAFACGITPFFILKTLSADNVNVDSSASYSLNKSFTLIYKCSSTPELSFVLTTKSKYLSPFTKPACGELLAIDVSTVALLTKKSFGIFIFVPTCVPSCLITYVAVYPESGDACCSTVTFPPKPKFSMSARVKKPAPFVNWLVLFGIFGLFVKSSYEPLNNPLPVSLSTFVISAALMTLFCTGFSELVDKDESTFVLLACASIPDNLFFSAVV